VNTLLVPALLLLGCGLSFLLLMTDTVRRTNVLSGMVGGAVLGAADRNVIKDGKLLDTSVLIDGRIAEVADAAFLQGTLLVPSCVLRELQGIADSADAQRRVRGRRGLDVLQRLREHPRLNVQIITEDPAAERDVDHKLVAIARTHQYAILTNDFNLSKVAAVQGLTVMNFNELAQSVRPVIRTGESISVLIQKEGKEPNQGVAYLDDGTMVVVDNARRLISRQVEITVTSVLQTQAGKMIFGRYSDTND
jgi:uncharacterized protein YacL